MGIWKQWLIFINPLPPNVVCGLCVERRPMVCLLHERYLFGATEFYFAYYVVKQNGFISGETVWNQLVSSDFKSILLNWGQRRKLKSRMSVK